jgi:hypothetical protein
MVGGAPPDGFFYFLSSPVVGRTTIPWIFRRPDDLLAIVPSKERASGFAIHVLRITGSSFLVRIVVLKAYHIGFTVRHRHQ